MTVLNMGKYLTLLFLCYTMLQSHAANSALEQTLQLFFDDRFKPLNQGMKFTGPLDHIYVS